MKTIVTVTAFAVSALASIWCSGDASAQDAPAQQVPGPQPSASGQGTAGGPLAPLFAACTGKSVGKTCTLASPTGQGAPAAGICQPPPFGMPGPIACIPSPPSSGQGAAQ